MAIWTTYCIFKQYFNVQAIWFGFGADHELPYTMAQLRRMGQKKVKYNLCISSLEKKKKGKKSWDMSC